LSIGNYGSPSVSRAPTTDDSRSPKIQICVGGNTFIIAKDIPFEKFVAKFCMVIDMEVGDFERFYYRQAADATSSYETIVSDVDEYKKMINRARATLWLRPQSDDDFKAPGEEEENLSLLSADRFHKERQDVCSLLPHSFLCFIILTPNPSQRQARMVLQI